eukprot:1159258-Pelagomonas_calceolata.AAC.4
MALAIFLHFDLSQALDFIVYVAGMHNLKLILALGNFWNAYKAPEEFLYWANPSEHAVYSHDMNKETTHRSNAHAHSAIGSSWMQDSRTRELYKDHITAILNSSWLVHGSPERLLISTAAAQVVMLEAFPVILWEIKAARVVCTQGQPLHGC